MDTISLQRLRVIEEYLNINGQPAPYYVHDYYRKFNFFPNRVLIGKGSPEEIRSAIQQGLGKLRRIGIDCSGFVCHIIASTQPITSVIKHPSSNPLTRLRFFLRPIENASVRILIHPINVEPVNKVSEIQPWDLIHVSDIHIAIVYNVEDNVIYYAHASEKEGRVAKGQIEIIDPASSLEKQGWSNASTQQYYQSYANSRVVRLCRDVFNRQSKP